MGIAVVKLKSGIQNTMKTPIIDEIMKGYFLSLLVVLTLHVKRENAYALRVSFLQKILVFHCYLTAHTAGSFGVNGLPNCVLLLEDNSENIWKIKFVESICL